MLELHLSSGRSFLCSETSRGASSLDGTLEIEKWFKEKYGVDSVAYVEDMVD